MRRLSLSAKLFVAVLPLLVAVTALLTLSIRDGVDDIDQARRGARLGSTWEPLIASIQAIESEQVISDTGDQAAIVDARRATDTSMSDLRQAVRDIGDSETMVLNFESATNALIKGRGGVDAGDDVQVSSTGIGTTTGTLVAVQEYGNTERELIGLGRLLADGADDVDLGRALYAVGSLAASEQIANDLVQTIGDWPASRYLSDIADAAALGDTLVASVVEFQNNAPEQWLAEFSDGQWAQRLTDSANELDDIVAEADRGRFEAFDALTFNESISGIATVRDKFAGEIVADANSKADTLRRTTFLQIGITLVAVVLAGLMAWFLTRSITRRVRAVSEKAREVATIQLPALVSALRDPRGRSAIPEVAPIEDAGTDELGELAGAFNVVQSTLVDVAHEQIEVLRRGVSDIFVTMARRTRSLIDRQLALLDELEADVDDPSVLANYYQLDHLATRMRRNSESLLVLASAESRRRRTKATEIDDVVRAAIGEVEEYRRIDVLNLDGLQVRGAVVADMSHLLAELLDNASSFSPPESRVAVSGRYAGEHYLISIVDEGVGIGTDRLVELNDILANPPIVGLSVEPTLGMSVVSLLAHKHGVHVRLVPSASGLLVEIALPATMYEPIDGAGLLGTEPASNGHAEVVTDNLIESTVGPDPIDTSAPQVVDDGELPAGPAVEPARAPEPALSIEPAHTPEPALDVEPVHTPEPALDIEPVHTPEPAAADPGAQKPTTELEAPGLTPPRSRDRVSGEFDRPPAPPAFGFEPTSRPFTDPTARAVPTRTETLEPVATGQSIPFLPTRSRGTGPDGPDRLAAQLLGPIGPPAEPVAPSTPSALKAALTAFEAGRAGARPDATVSPILPTRDPGNAFDHDEVTTSTSQSRLDPETIRERLRSFRKEFQLGRDGEGAAGPDGDQTDLGGDR
ncbi:MAG TPA: ATP-binding protein [Ilumatobacteraceae bacterium]|nr:ATP-binding protein [Ilumatobacteraceae bacterium]